MSQDIILQEALTKEELDALEVDLITSDKEAPSEEQSSQPQYATTNSPSPGNYEDHEILKQQEQNLSALLDVELDVVVELGETVQDMRSILSLSGSAIIDLEKPANDPVNIYAGNRLVAKGEVVVIDENFGVRITHIASPSDRIKILNS